jgi:hypothetical protein
MNAFQQAGEAQLLAVEGQALIGRMLVAHVGGLFRSLVQAFARPPVSGLPRR